MQTDHQSRPLFTFGTLMDDAVLELVLNRLAPPDALESAVLSGYRRARLSDETYPVLMRDQNSRVHGRLVYGLRAQDWARIEFFEGSEYALSPCTVHTTRGAPVAAWYCAEAETAGAADPWTLDWWQQHHKSGFLEITRAYMALFDARGDQDPEALWRTLRA